MTLLLRDDKGVLHPVLLNVTTAEHPELVRQAEETNRQLGARYNYRPEPIHCD